MTNGRARSGWTFLTNHAHVMVCLAEQPDSRGRDIAERVGITERATQAIIADLIADGYLSKERDGRRNRYELHLDAPLRHPLESEQTIGDLLNAVLSGAPATKTSTGK